MDEPRRRSSKPNDWRSESHDTAVSDNFVPVLDAGAGSSPSSSSKVVFESIFSDYTPTPAPDPTVLMSGTFEGYGVESPVRFVSAAPTVSELEVARQASGPSGAPAQQQRGQEPLRPDASAPQPFASAPPGRFVAASPPERPKQAHVMQSMSSVEGARVVGVRHINPSTGQPLTERELQRLEAGRAQAQAQVRPKQPPIRRAPPAGPTRAELEVEKLELEVLRRQEAMLEGRLTLLERFAAAAALSGLPSNVIHPSEERGEPPAQEESCLALEPARESFAELLQRQMQERLDEFKQQLQVIASLPERTAAEIQRVKEDVNRRVAEIPNDLARLEKLAFEFRAVDD